MAGELERKTMTSESFTPGPGRERALRTALGAFATGVTVVTVKPLPWTPIVWVVADLS